MPRGFCGTVTISYRLSSIGHQKSLETDKTRLPAVADYFNQIIEHLICKKRTLSESTIEFRTIFCVHVCPQAR